MDYRENCDIQSERAIKKRRLTSDTSFASQPVQSSFAGVLERLNQEAGGAVGASCHWRTFVQVTYLYRARCGRWCRQLVTTFPKTSGRNARLYQCVFLLLLTMPTSYIYILVFQQIDVEDSIDSNTGAATLRMFGVTEVCHDHPPLFHHLLISQSRKVTVSLPT